MINSDVLKERLIKIEENSYRIPDSINIMELASDMMQNIGSVDPELRDDLIYSTFNEWTMNGVFTAEQMHQILNISLDDNHLFYRIGERDTDAVFTRTFSVLMIPLALHIDRNQSFLSKEEMVDIKEKLFKYLKLENDTRGYVEGKGWAHSTAHAADAIGDIARSNYINHADLLEILDAIKTKICISNYTYINEEDERMVTATMSVFSRKLLEDTDIIKWINSFGEIERSGKYPEKHHLKMNVKGFLRSLYFKMLGQRDFEVLMEAVLKTLLKW